MVQPANSLAPADVNDSTFCWSCLQTFQTSQLVTLDHVGTALPVCPACWKQMTVSERVHAANQIMFVSTAVELINNVVEFSGIVNEHVKTELGQGMPWWAKGGGITEPPAGGDGPRPKLIRQHCLSETFKSAEGPLSDRPQRHPIHSIR